MFYLSKNRDEESFHFYVPLFYGFLAFVVAFLFVPSAYVLKWVTILLLLAPGVFFLTRERFAALKMIAASPVFWPLCMFFIYGVGQAIFLAVQTHVPVRSVIYIAMLLVFIFTLMLLFMRIRKQDLERLILVVILGATLAGVVVLYFYVRAAAGSLVRLNGIGAYDNSNLAGFVFAQFGVISAGTLMAGHQERPSVVNILLKVITGLGLLTCTAVVTLTQGKGVYLSYVVSLIIMLALFGYRKVVWLLFGVMLAGLVSLLYVLKRADAPSLLRHVPFGHALYERGDSYRVGVWETALRLIPEHPWLGYGFETTYPYFLHPHNLVLSTVYYYGFVGLALFLPCVIGTIWAARRSRPLEADEKTFYACYWVFLIGGIADFGPVLTRVSVYWVIFWLPFAIFHGLRLRKIPAYDAASSAVRPLDVYAFAGDEENEK